MQAQVLVINSSVSYKLRLLAMILSASFELVIAVNECISYVKLMAIFCSSLDCQVFQYYTESNGYDFSIFVSYKMKIAF